MCVQPLYNYDNILEFLEWIEFHKLMGVSHFTFYNISIGPDTSSLLRSPEKLLGTQAIVMPWNPLQPELESERKVHAHGQPASASDCILRYRGVAKHVVFLDLDEFLTIDPSIAKNYSQLISLLYKKNKRKTIVQYKVRSAFFGINKSGRDKDQKRETKTVVKQNMLNLEEMDLITFRQIERMAGFYKAGSRYFNK